MREQAELILRGQVLTVEASMPRAEALAISGGRILGAGPAAEVEALRGPATRVVSLGDACVMPGFIEAHGHPTTEAILAASTVDIRPVTIPDASSVLDTIRRTLAQRGAKGAYFNGWDALLQEGLPQPTRAWLDELSPGAPLVILHNSGHSAYFNTKAAEAAGVSRDTPDPEGASFGRDADGELAGVAYETAAVVRMMTPGVRLPGGLATALRDECARLNRAGVTSCSDMAFNPASRAALQRARDDGAITARLRLYEVSSPALTSDAAPGDGDDLVRQVGIKLWADGSPWIGNIETSFPYLDTPQARMLGLPPGHRGAMNYGRDEIARMSAAYFDAGWQIACHAQGDVTIDAVLDAWEGMLAAMPRTDHRLRLEHCSAMTPPQFERAARMGVACSIFVDHLWYWGDVLVSALFGEEHGPQWARAGSSFRAGVRTSFHNDGGVTPIEPLRNMQVAVTRRSRGGRLLAPAEAVTVEQAVRAQTVDAAYQLFMDDIVGSIAPGAYADLVVLSRDPTRVPPDELAGVAVLATLLAGDVVFGAL